MQLEFMCKFSFEKALFFNQIASAKNGKEFVQSEKYENDNDSMEVDEKDDLPLSNGQNGSLSISLNSS